MPPGFVPHLSNLELIRQAGIFYPRITDLTGKHTDIFLVFLFDSRNGAAAEGEKLKISIRQKRITNEIEIRNSNIDF